MNAEMKAKVELMAGNFHELKQAFAWDSNLIKHFGAMVTATREAKVDVERVREIRRFIKEETSWASYFRGNNEMIFAMLLQGEAQWEQLFKRAVAFYDELKVSGFSRGAYLPLAAYTLAKNAEDQDHAELFKNMEIIYQSMKHHHFWLTSQDDYVLAAVLASSKLDLGHVSEEMETCYQRLNGAGLYKGNELQSLSHVLALGEESAAVKCDRAIAIYKRLKASKCKLQYHGLSSLGVLTLVSDQPEQIADEVIEVYEYLYQTEGYGFWGIDSGLRAILAASIVSDYYADQLAGGLLESNLANSVAAILIAQQTAVIAAVAATTAATSASTSS